MPAKKKTANKSTAAKSSPAKASTAKPAAAAQQTAAPELLSETCVLGDVSKILLDGTSEKLSNSGRWPFVVDPSERVAVFLRYRNANCLSTLNPQEMETERLRVALIGSIRFGKPLVIDMMDTDMFNILTDNFNKVQPNLMSELMSKEILKDEKYMTLVRDSDAQDYQPSNFDHFRVKDFSFIILGTKQPSPALGQQTFVINVEN